MKKFEKAVAIAELQLQPVIPPCLSLSSFNGAIALNLTVNLSPTAYGSN